MSPITDVACRTAYSELATIGVTVAAVAAAVLYIKRWDKEAGTTKRPKANSPHHVPDTTNAPSADTQPKTPNPTANLEISDQAKSSDPAAGQQGPDPVAESGVDAEKATPVPKRSSDANVGQEGSGPSGIVGTKEVKAPSEDQVKKQGLLSKLRHRLPQRSSKHDLEKQSPRQGTSA